MPALRILLIITGLMLGGRVMAALVNCPECQRQVSDAAAQCPGCGLPGFRLRGGTPTPPPREFRPATREVKAWADTEDNGFSASPFTWTASGVTLTEKPEGLHASPANPAGDAQIQLRVRTPPTRGRLIIQFLGTANGDVLQVQYGNERESGPTGYMSRSEFSGGRSANLYLYSAPRETPVVKFLVPADGLTIERVRMFWNPDQADGFTSSLNPPPLLPSPKPKAVTAGVVRDSMVLVQTGAGTGLGFLARSGSEVFVFTSQQVLSGAKTFVFRNAAGKSFTPVAMEIADKEDLVRLALNAENALTAGEVLRLATGEPRAGERVLVHGIGAGAPILLEMAGEVLSAEPASLAVSASFGEGSSGGPVCNKGGEVIGVASFMRRGTDAGWVPPDSPFARSQRLVHRITPAVTWTKVQPQAFLAQARAAEDTLRVLGVLSASLERLRMVPSTTEVQTPYLDLRFIKEETEKARLDARWSQQLGLFAQRFAFVEGKSDRRLNPGEVQRHVANLQQEYNRLADLAAGEAGKTRWMSGYLRERAAQATGLAGAIRTHVNTALSGK